MSGVGTVRLLGAMLTEEWRLHTQLFGGRRFAAFPLFVLSLAAGAFALLFYTGADQLAIVGGLHALVGFFGLQVGTLGLIGRDAMRNVLGDVTLIVFTSRTLPVSWRRLLGVFLLKDLLYYSVLFLAPIALAYMPLALAQGSSPLEILLLWLTLTAVFALGVGLSLTLVGLASRSRPALLGIVAVLAAVALGTSVDLIAFTPYALYVSPSPVGAVQGLGPTVVALAFGLVAFEPVEDSSRGRQRLFPVAAVADLLPDRDGLARRALVDVTRSSGSVWKVVFSMGVLFGVAALLLLQLASATALDPAAGIGFGTLLGLGGFTTYTWLTQFDEAEEYRRLPVTVGDVLRGKLLAYLVLILPTGLAYLALAALWFPVGELLVGAVVFPLVSVYVFGLTAYVAGLSPTELLFDTPRFMLFGAGLSLVSVPLLVASLSASQAPTAATVGAVVGSAVAAAVGLVLTRLAGPRWDERLRA